MASPAETRFRGLHQFGDFYAEIFRLKQMARAEGATPEVHLPTGTSTGDGSADGTDGNSIWTSVAELLDRKVAEDKRTDDPTADEVQRELLYIMVAVTDEAFVRLEWPGRAYWQANLFEQRLFQSNIAGERIFRDIDRILARQDEVAADLATVYLAVLGVGFRGRYAEKDDSGAIELYRRKLESALERWGGETHGKSVPVPVPEALPDLKQRSLRFEGTPEIRPGASSLPEQVSKASRSRVATLVASCTLTAVLSFAAGAVCGLVISSRIRSAPQEARPSSSANAATPSSNIPIANSHQTSVGGAPGLSATEANAATSPADPRPSTGSSTVSLVETQAGLPRPSTRPWRSSITPTKIDSFTVQVGAFRIQENAVRLAESLEALGYQPQVLRRTDADARSWHVVRVGPYPNRQTALGVADKLSAERNLGLHPFVSTVHSAVQVR